MKWLNYFWSLLTNLIALVVIVEILSSGYSKFEKLVLALLMLNYLRICTLELYLGESYRGTTLQYNTWFLRISELLKDPSIESAKDAASEVAENFKKLAPKIWINIIFNGLSWFFVVFTILDSL